MWVVPIDTMLELATAGCNGELLPTHDVMKAAGRIVPWQPGMKTHTPDTASSPAYSLLLY